MSKDLFSTQSDLYAKFRPSYPTGLIEYILEFVPEKKNAWDCATGNGQVAIILAEYFEKVEATDISEKQLSLAIHHPRINYNVAAAEHTPFESNRFDLVTAAQAYHWFSHKAFNTEVKRVSRNKSIIAVWGYNVFKTNHNRINQLIDHFYLNIVGPYWEYERKFVDEEYENCWFDFEEIQVDQKFSIHVEWTLQHVLGYLNSWSSVQKFMKVNQRNPVDELKETLQEIWPSQESISFNFPLFVRLGRVNK